MGKAKRFNTYDSSVAESRKISQQFGQQRQDKTGISSSFRDPPGSGLATTTTAASIVVANSPLTTKGDIWGYSTIDDRIPLGTNGHVLTADSTTGLGVKWASAGAGSVPAGMTENDHLEWDDTGGVWVAGQNFTYGPTGPFADSGFNRFANDAIMLSARNIADDGNLEFKVDSGDFFDFTESNNGPVSLKIRAQHATNPDNTLTITQLSGTTGVGQFFAPNEMQFLGSGSSNVFNYDQNRIVTNVNINPDADGTINLGGTILRYSAVHAASFKFDTNRRLDFNTGGGGITVDGVLDSFTINVDSLQKASFAASLTTLSGAVDITGLAGINDKAEFAEITAPAGDPDVNTGWMYGKVVGGTHTEPFWEDELGTVTNLFGATELDDLTDVTIGTPSANTVLKWSGSAWVDGNVVDANIDAGAAIAWTKIDKTGSSLDDLDDTLIGTPAANTVLKWSGTDWVDGNVVNANIDAGAAIAGSKIDMSIDELNDVTIGTPASNTVLKWSGSAWVDGNVVNANIDAGAAIDISKLNITGTPDGTQFLRDDGTWQVPSGGGGVSFPIEPTVTDNGDTWTGTQTLNLSTGDGHVYKWIVDQDLTMGTTVSNVPADNTQRTFELEYVHDNIGGTFTVTLPTSPAFVDEDGVTLASFDLSDGGRAILACRVNEGSGGNIIVLQKNVAAASAGASQMSDLSDVSFGTPAPKDYLRYTGSVWQDSPLLITDISLADTFIIVGDGSGVAASVAVSGDATLANTGALTIAAGAIDIAMHSATGTPGVTTYYRGDNTWATIPSGSKHTIEDEGTPLTARTKLNFVGAGVSVADDAGDDATDVTITGGAEITLWTANHDANGNLLILDPDGDSSISSASDDSIQVQTGGSIRMSVDNTGVTVQNTLLANGDVSLGNAGGDDINMNGTVQTDIDIALGSYVDFNGDQSGVGSAGSASSLPSLPTGYLRVKLNGTVVVVPYYDES